MRRFQKRFLSAIVCVVFVYVVIAVQKPNFDSAYFSRQKQYNDVKYVLYWTPAWNTKDYFMGLGFKPFESCEYKNCYATENRTFVPLKNFDAIIFPATAYEKKLHGVPSHRYPHQRYIMLYGEAPLVASPDAKQFSSFYNWTMTYRFDSDLIRRHGTIVRQPTDYVAPSIEDVKKRPKLAAWFVSNCVTDSKREALKAIRRYIPLDIYGKCGNMTCKKKNNKISSTECYDMVEHTYKFYFSFENSYCKDYATEKLYKILKRNVVPVVYGFGDYDLAAPPHSVVNVADFGSVKELADYLVHLDRNPEEYLKYFEWKKHMKIDASQKQLSCQMCQKLNTDARKKVYKDVHEWWRGRDNSMCRVGKRLPKIVTDLLRY